MSILQKEKNTFQDYFKNKKSYNVLSSLNYKSNLYKKKNYELKTICTSYSSGDEGSFENLNFEKNNFYKNKKNNNQKRNFQSSNKYKTEICKNFELYQKCKWGDNCCFAHGKTELRKNQTLNSFYKTKICKHYHQNGFCPYGLRCQYFHFKSYGIYKEFLEIFVNKFHGNLEKFNKKTFKKNLENDPIHPRLNIFKKLCKGGNNLSLYEKFVLKMY